MKYIPAFWRNALTLYFVVMTLSTVYLLFFYQNPYPDVPGGQYAPHTDITNLFASGLKFFIYGYFLRYLWIERQYGMSQAEYAGFRAWLMVYWIFAGALSLGFYMIVSLINEDMTGSEHAISWFRVFFKSVEIYALWFFLYKVGKGPPIHFN